MYPVPWVLVVVKCVCGKEGYGQTDLCSLNTVISRYGNHDHHLIPNQARTSGAIHL